MGLTSLILSDKYARNRGHFFASFIGIISASVSAQESYKPYLVAEHFARSEAASIATIYNDLIGEFDSGERSYQFQWYEAGYQLDGWSWGVVIRKDYFFQYSEDTAELVGAIWNGDELEEGREYDIWFESQAFKTTGLRFAWQPEVHPNIDIELGLSALYAYYILDGSIEGIASALDSTDYDYSLSVDYAYLEDYLFERDIDSVFGYGLSADLDFEAKLNHHLSWHLRVRDLLGAIYWPDAPQTLATAFSDRVTVTDSGYAQWDPVVSGTETTEDLLQKLSPRINSELYGAYGKFQAGYGLQYWQEDLLTRAGAGYDFGGVQLFGWYWMEDSGIELTLSWPAVAVSIGVDHVDPDKIHSVYTGLKINY